MFPFDFKYTRMQFIAYIKVLEKALGIAQVSLNRIDRKLALESQMRLKPFR